MSCNNQNTVLEGTKHPTKFRAVPNEQEELRAAGWAIISNGVTEMTDTAFAFDLKGNKDKASLYYEGGNLYFYFLELAIIMNTYTQSQKLFDNPCTVSDVREKYNLDCIESNLTCLSKKYQTNFKETWENLKSVFGLGTYTGDCDCCPGIGSMIVGHPDDCLAFIIGGCSSSTDDELSGGAFDPCGFEVGSFEISDDLSVYETCS